jgi:hypothetical protein
MGADSIGGRARGNREFVLLALNIETVVPTGSELILVLSLLAVVMFVWSLVALRHDAAAPVPVPLDRADERPAPPVAPPFHRAG